MSATGHLGEKLSAYLDDELSPAERAAAEQHLRECAACAQLLEELAAVDSAARALPVAAPEGYFDAFPGRVRERLAARRARRIPAWTWAAAAAVLLAVLTPLTLRSRPSAPATAEMKPAVGTAAGDRAAQEESSFGRAQPAAATAAPPTTLVLTADEKEKLRAHGYVGEAPALEEGQTRESRQKRDAAQDDRLRERDADAGAGGAGVAPGVVGGVVGGRTGPAPRTTTDLKDAELKKEAFGEKEAADKLNQNTAAAAGAPAPVPESVVAAQAPQLAARADESAASLQRAEPQKQSPAVASPPQQASGADQPAAPAPPPAEAPRAEGYAAKPKTAEGAALRATKAADAPARTFSADEARFAEEFEALASRPLRQAEDARTAARQWSELARRHPQAKAADEARVRAIEAWATAWRLEHQDADRDQARKESQAYLAAGGPQKDRVRAVLDQLAR